MEAFFNWATGLFNDPAFPYRVAEWMAFIALVLVVAALILTAAKVLLIRKRTKVLTQVVQESGGIQECRTEFHKRFSAIDNQFGRSSSKIGEGIGEKKLRLAWLEFAESLLEPDDHALRKNTVRPQAFFLRALRGPQWLEFWGNVAVGVGLFFTFLGLVAALQKANAGISAGDMGAMQTSLAELLAVASAKFITSIMGVGVSLVLKICGKALSAWLNRALHAVCHNLEMCLLYVSTQTLAAKQLAVAEASRDLLKEQAHEIGMQFGKQIQPLVLEMQRAGEAQREAIQTGIGGIVGEEVQAMSASLNGLAGTLGGLGGQLEQSGQVASQQIGQAAASLQSLVDELPRRLSAASSEAADALAQAGQASAAQVAALQDGFAQTATDLGRLAPFLENWERVAATSTDALRAALAELGASLTQFSGMANRLRDANRDLRDTLEASDMRLQTGLQSVSLANDNAGQLAQTLAESEASMGAAWEGYSERFEGVDASLGEAVQSVAQTYADYHAGMSEHARMLDKHFGDAVSSLASVIEELRDALDEAQAGRPSRLEAAE